MSSYKKIIVKDKILNLIKSLKHDVKEDSPFYNAEIEISNRLYEDYVLIPNLDPYPSLNGYKFIDIMFMNNDYKIKHLLRVLAEILKCDFNCTYWIKDNTIRLYIEQHLICSFNIEQGIDELYFATDMKFSQHIIDALGDKITDGLDDPFYTLIFYLFRDTAEKLSEIMSNYLKDNMSSFKFVIYNLKDWEE